MGHVENDEEGNEGRVENELRCLCGERELCSLLTGPGFPWFLVRRRLVKNPQRKIGWGYDIISLTHTLSVFLVRLLCFYDFMASDW